MNGDHARRDTIDSYSRYICTASIMQCAYLYHFPIIIEGATVYTANSNTQCRVFIRL